MVFAAWGSGGGVAEVRSGSLDVRGGFGGRNMVLKVKIFAKIFLFVISCFKRGARNLQITRIATFDHPSDPLWQPMSTTSGSRSVIGPRYKEP